MPLRAWQGQSLWYGHPKGSCTLPVRAAHGERCGPRTAPTPCPVQRPHRSPYGPRTVLPLPVPYRFAPAGPVPFCPYGSRTVLPAFFFLFFFIVESANEGLPLQKLSPFAIQKAFQAIAELWRTLKDWEMTPSWWSAAKGPRPKTCSKQTDLLTDQSRSQFTRPRTPLWE